MAVAVSLGLDVFAVCVGVGMRGTDIAQRVRIGIAFASAEILMNVLGALLGAAVGGLIGNVAGYLGFAALIGIGVYMIVESSREEQDPLDLSRGWGLVLGSLSISLDSLGIGFSILYIGVPVVLTLVTIGIVSIAATWAGLSLGRLLGLRVEAAAARWAGIVLILTGAGFAAQKYFAHS